MFPTTIIPPKILSNSLSLSLITNSSSYTLSHYWSTDLDVNFIRPYPPPIRRRLWSHHHGHPPNHCQCCHLCLLLPYFPSNDDATDDDDDNKIMDPDVVELLAEHIHFCEIKIMERFLALCHVFHNSNSITDLWLRPSPLSSGADNTVMRHRFSCWFEGFNRNRNHRRFEYERK